MSEASFEAHLTGFMRGGAHILPIRVYYEDTDFSARVYHASYLRFMERGARSSCVRSRWPNPTFTPTWTASPSLSAR